MLNLISNIRTTRLKSRNSNHTGFKEDLSNYTTDDLLLNEDPDENVILSKNWLAVYR